MIQKLGWASAKAPRLKLLQTGHQPIVITSTPGFCQAQSYFESHSVHIPINIQGRNGGLILTKELTYEK